jgi:hypothetical protein
VIDPEQQFQSPCENCPVWQAYLEIGVAYAPEDASSYAFLQSGTYQKLSQEEEEKCFQLGFGNKLDENQAHILDSSDCNGGKRRIKLCVDGKFRLRKICQGTVKTIPIKPQL